MSALEQLLPEPRIGRIGFGIGVPVEVAVECRDLKRKRQKPVAELGVEDAGVARRQAALPVPASRTNQSLLA